MEETNNPTLVEVSEVVDKSRSKNVIEIIEEDIDISGLQVVRKEHFAHTYDPSISIKPKGVRFSASLVRKLADVDDVIFLMDPVNMKLIVKSVDADDRDAVKWSKIEKKTGRRMPKDNIPAARLSQKLYRDMGWSADTWYKIIGKIVHSRGETLIVFNLKDAEQHIVTKDNRQVLLPKEWENSYGYVFTERDKEDSVGLLAGYQRMEIVKKVKKVNPPVTNDTDQLSLLENNSEERKE